MSHGEALPPVRVLVTGAGGPAAFAVIDALRPDPTVTLLAADMDPWAAGLFQVGSDHRVIVPEGVASEFVDVLLDRCLEHRVDLVVPTVDAELLPLAHASAAFTNRGIRMLIPTVAALETTLDKFALAHACAGVVSVPRTEILARSDPESWDYPVIVKPRRGSGSRNVVTVHSPDTLEAMRPLAGLLCQEHLPGEEYSVDVLADHAGRVSAAVPRVRQRVDSGVSVAGYTVNDADLERFARTVVESIGLPFISNVQIRRRSDGRPALLEINPRVPGCLALTVAAGIDMARMAVDALRGAPIPRSITHRQVAMVRYLSSQVIAMDELVVAAGAALERHTTRQPVGADAVPS